LETEHLLFDKKIHLPSGEFWYKLAELTYSSINKMAKKSTPKKQTSNSQSKCRQKAFQNFARKRLLDSIRLTTCPKCKEAMPMHTVCHNCGEYNGRKVIDMQKKVDKITKVKA